MALALDAAGDWIQRTTSLPAANAFTVCGWGRPVAAIGDDEVITILSNNTGSENHGYGYLGGSWCIFNAVDPFSVFSRPVPGSGEWFFWALRADGSNIIGDYARLTDTTIETITETYRTFTPAGLVVGADFTGGGSLNFNGRLAAVKVWDAALSTAEIERERWTIRPQRMANLHIWSPLFLNSTDFSGNGRNWTEGGTLAWEDGPPISWGSILQTPGFSAAATQIWLPGYYV